MGLDTQEKKQENLEYFGLRTLSSWSSKFVDVLFEYSYEYMELKKNNGILVNEGDTYCNSIFFSNIIDDIKLNYLDDLQKYIQENICDVCDVCDICDLFHNNKSIDECLYDRCIDIINILDKYKEDKFIFFKIY